MNTVTITILLVIFSQLITDINSQLNFLQSEQESLITPDFDSFLTRQQPRRPNRQARPRNNGFSFFREFIEPLPGVLNDIFPSTTSEDPIVETTNGLLKGTLKRSRDGRKYAAFLGIPYAQPPMGNLRFEPPQKLTNRWKGIRDASRFQSPCFHMDVFVTGRKIGTENCLYANVYTPKINASLPVVVYIHGGGFSSGSGDFYQGKYFMDTNIVLVVFNYRLAGFLNIGSIRGNVGLKDQTLLLNWVQENIENFGGNKNLVTIMGESAGGASVGYHIISKQSKGLFHKAIALSGTPLSPWALSRSPVESALRLAKTVGCPTKIVNLTIECLKSLSPQEISKGYIGMTKTISGPSDFFQPSIETSVTGDTLLTENPESIFKRGDFNKVPLMLGVSSMEGLLYASRILADEKAKKELGRKWNDWVPKILGYDAKNTTRTEKLKSFYFPSWTHGNLDLSDRETFVNLTHLLSDALFMYPSHEMAKLYRKHAPLYLSYNTYQGRISVHDILSKVPVLAEETDNELRPVIPEVAVGTGLLSDLIRYRFTNQRPSTFQAGHGDAVMLLFNIRRAPGIGRLSMDYEMSKEFVKSIAEFATNEKQLFFDQVAWPKANDNPIMKYIKLDLPGRVIYEPIHDRMAMWDHVY